MTMCPNLSSPATILLTTKVSNSLMRKLKTSKFSKAQLAIFVIAFALIGYLIFKSFALNPNLPGDLNNDNSVNVTDLSILLSNYGTANSTADINSDGTVNILDMSILLSHYGSSYTPPVSTRIYTADFSTGDFSQIVSLQESSIGRITMVTPGVGGQKYAAKVLTGAQDQGVAGASGYRTEVYVQGFSQHLGGGSLQGKEVWVGWTIKLGAGFQVPSGYLVLTQFHAGYGSPVFAITMDSLGRIVVEQRGGAYTDNGGSSGNYREAILMTSPPRETDFNLVVHRIFSVNSDGLTQVWLNKSPTTNAPDVSMTGPTLEIGQEASPYMKFGMYGGNWPPPDNVLYGGNIRWATSATGL